MPTPVGPGAPAAPGTIDSLTGLEALYGVPGKSSIVKETNRLTPGYRRMMEASPFYALATVGPERLDVSQPSDQTGFVSVLWISIASIYFQCARALLRSRLWQNAMERPDGLSMPGALIAKTSSVAYGGPDYDAQPAARLPILLY